MLLLLSGDVESNPGPIEHCLSIIHSNIRSIRNKLEFIKNTLVDFDVLCSTESHFDASIDSSSLILSDLCDCHIERTGQTVVCISEQKHHQPTNGRPKNILEWMCMDQDYAKVVIVSPWRVIQFRNS